MNRLITTRFRQFHIGCYYENDRLTELRNLDERSYLNNIYRARVKDVVPNINAAFVEILPGVVCYLELGNKPIQVLNRTATALASGDEILVQVTRDAMKTKAPSVDTALNLIGMHVIVTDSDPRFHCSRRMDRTQSEMSIQLLKKNQMNAYGAILRTQADTAHPEKIVAEYQELVKDLQEIKHRGAGRKPYTCLYEAQTPLASLLQTNYVEDYTEIITDEPMDYEEICAWLSKHASPKAKDRVQIYESLYQSLADHYRLDKDYTEATNRKVWLKSGGYLVIEQTEALTAIDVNTGKSDLGRDKRKHIRKTNLEATDEIAKQLRLRNISGMILVDYIDMTEEEDRMEIAERLQQVIRRDPVQTNFIDITKLGLYELTRKKIRKSLAEWNAESDFFKKND